ncbi:MAG: hypothetical protein U9N61_05960 [Euryarchaeota archaeon]|nr:hypothetical protein [Euryarchaeota archaeon]
MVELKNNDFLKSDCYKKLPFGDNYIKENLPSIGIDNQGNLLMTLYTMLVIPRQLLSDNFPTEFAELNNKVENIISEEESSYSTDSAKIDYITHIRNAVAHARVMFIPNESITFTDKNNKGEICKITIPLVEVGIFLTELQKVFMKYIETLKVKMNKK